MSHIAAALAKSKGKKVDSPPPGTPPAPLVMPAPKLPMPVRPAAGETPAQTEKKTPLMPVLGGAAILVLAATVWYVLKPAEVPLPPTPAPPVARPVAPPKPPVVSMVAPETAGLPPAPPGPPPVVEQPSVVLLEQVAKFTVRGRISGQTQRVMIDGKVYVPGDHVTDNLVLQEVLSDHVVFRDDHGQLYTK